MHREAGVLIIHSPVNLGGESAATIFGQKYHTLGELYMPGTMGIEISDEVTPLPVDVVLPERNSADAFIRTGLQDILKEKGITNLIISGFNATLSVNETVDEASESHDLTCYTLKDGIGVDNSRSMPANILFSLQLSSTVITCDQAKAML